MLSDIVRPKDLRSKIHRAIRESHGFKKTAQMGCLRIIVGIFFCVLSAGILSAALITNTHQLPSNDAPAQGQTDSISRTHSGLLTQQIFSFTHPAMGTIYSLYLYANSRAEAEANAGPVFQEIDRVEDLLSNYRESSELSRINREASVSAVTTDPETFHFLQTSFGWSARSNGAFDITVGRLMKVWGFFRAHGSIPDDAQLAQVRRQVGWKRVKLDPRLRTVRFLSPGVELDPGGIGKGYAVERAVRLMRTEHITAALLSAGSSTIYALGAPPGQAGWKVRVPAPGDPAHILSTVLLRDTSLSTANCSEKYFVQKGHLYCSIMDPHTLRPVEGTLQTTVIAPSATDSDALSNVFFVLSEKQSASLLRQLPQDSALIVTGKVAAARCETARWKTTVRTGYCNTLDILKEN